MGGIIEAAYRRGQTDERKQIGNWLNAKPKVVCLCGSGRFADAFTDAASTETLKGRIVLTIGVSKHAGDPLTTKQAERLDELHLRKIDLADEVLILNVGGYIGSSTRREIEYAESLGKQIRYLEKVDDGHQD